MTDWKQLPGTGYPDQEGEVAWPFYAQVGPEGDSKWSWTLLRANLDGTQEELTGSSAGAAAASEELAKMLAEAAGLGALAQYETAESGTALTGIKNLLREAINALDDKCYGAARDNAQAALNKIK
jgi:hypothetical protein